MIVITQQNVFNVPFSFIIFGGSGDNSYQKIYPALYDIAEKKKIADLRIKSIEKQEETLRKRAKELQAEVLGAMKKEP